MSSFKSGLLLVIALFGWPALADFTFDSKVPPETQVQLRSDLAWLNAIHGGPATELYRQVFGAAEVGKGLQAYLASRIKKVSMASCGGNSNVPACVYPFFGRTMYLTTTYVNTVVPQVLRLSTIVHEARHTEASKLFWQHTRCPTPYLDENGRDIVSLVTLRKAEGNVACDKHALGAYGVETIFLKNLERSCLSCNQKIRMDAKLFGDHYTMRISKVDARTILRNDSLPAKR